ncbi:uncharacterized protein LOC142628191 isoform X1 [Castanea sativa]|uniref:uncharacterized protein LOC142628191 isoform X1 n=1 Tax=Castanea sativa TaxID=21020 RepID=UPI003F64C8C9
MASAFATSFFLLFNLASLHHHVLARDVVEIEEGYTVTTLIDGHKLGINPRSILPKPGSSDLLLLDSVSSIVYTLSFPTSKESKVKVNRLAGASDRNGGYADGELDSARFNKPRSFAVDLKGNVYVADKTNHAIRKISNTGVKTIAGGYSKNPGHQDGPAKNATFSDDFEISFVPEKCALLISDHGNQLVRLISLKSEDCVRGSQFALGAVSIWVLGLGLSCLLGLIVGIAVQPYIFRRKGFSPLFFKTWMHCLIRLGKQVLILCFDIRSAVARSSYFTLLRRLFWLSLSHLSLMFRMYKVKSPISHKEYVSLIDCDDISSSKLTQSEMYADQLKDLMTIDGGLDLLNMADKIVNHSDDDKEGSDDTLTDSHGKVDAMIQANIMGFAEPAEEQWRGF